MHVLHRKYPLAHMRWYCAGPEKGVASLMRAMPGEVPLHDVPATQDKFVRAQPASAGWNAGRVLVPDAALAEMPWVQPFLDEVMGFTGVGDAHDDQVDALAAAYDVLNSGHASRLQALGRM
jgi:predicted phage terminase large subunit-like protein